MIFCFKHRLTLQVLTKATATSRLKIKIKYNKTRMSIINSTKCSQ